MLPKGKRYHHIYVYALMVVILLLSALLGRYPKPGLMNPQLLWQDSMAWNIFFNLRLPRILGAVVLGMALSASGLVFQTILGNPLVEPGFLGVSQGAAFGAALAIISFHSYTWTTPLFAILFALLALVLSWLLARRITFGGWIIRLILSGITVSAFFSAALGGVKYVADPNTELQEITFWLLGGLSGMGWASLIKMSLLCLPPIALISLFKWRLNLLSMGDRTAYSLGVSPVVEKNFFLLVAVIACAGAVAYCGIISWVGLIIPHIARRLMGSDTRKSVPAALALGACFTMICDDLGRTISRGEIPLGIVTSLLGAVFFTLLMLYSPQKRQL